MRLRMPASANGFQETILTSSPPVLHSSAHAGHAAIALPRSLPLRRG